MNDFACECFVFTSLRNEFLIFVLRFVQDGFKFCEIFRRQGGFNFSQLALHFMQGIQNILAVGLQDTQHHGRGCPCQAAGGFEAWSNKRRDILRSGKRQRG